MCLSAATREDQSNTGSGAGAGFAGIAIAVSPQFAGVLQRGLTGLAIPVLINLVAMLSVTLGTLYQKRYLGEGDLRGIATLQYLGAFAVTAPLAYGLETGRFD